MGNKDYDLEERTFQFAKACRSIIKTIKKNSAIIHNSK
jgi:hypothetical protein